MLCEFEHTPHPTRRCSAHGRSELKLHVVVRASARLFPATVDRMCTGDPPSPQGEGKGKSVFLAGRFLLCAVFGSPLRTPVRRISLPLEGKVSAEPTDEVCIQIQHRLCHNRKDIK